MRENRAGASQCTLSLEYGAALPRRYSVAYRHLYAFQYADGVSAAVTDIHLSTEFFRPPSWPPVPAEYHTLEMSHIVYEWVFLLLCLPDLRPPQIISWHEDGIGPEET
jgi:hypothetical protein